MTDVALRLADMDRVGMDVAVLSLSTPNVFFVEGRAQADVAKMVNDAYAELVAAHRGRFLGFASIAHRSAKRTVSAAAPRERC